MTRAGSRWRFEDNGDGGSPAGERRPIWAQARWRRCPGLTDSFELVTGFNSSFFFANDLVTALREAARVAKPGAPVVI